MKSFLLATLLFLGFTAQAQKKQNIYFLKQDGRQVNEIDSADFIRVIQEPDSGTTHFPLFEFYPDKSRKKLGKVSAFELSLMYEGTIMSYNKTGGREKVENYKDGIKNGMTYSYYPNGKLESAREYGTTGGMVEPAGYYGKTVSYRLVDYYDSTGVQLVKNGNGIARLSDNDGRLQEEGAYVNGVKDGKWVGVSGNNKFTEEFSNGEFVSGVATYDGADHTYNIINELPSFKGGIDKFIQYVGYAFTYPSDAKASGAGGRISVKFVVERDGSLSDIKLLNSISRSIDQETLRVVKRSPKWIPGKQHGIPVRVTFTLPINLSSAPQ